MDNNHIHARLFTKWLLAEKCLAAPIDHDDVYGTITV